MKILVLLFLACALSACASNVYIQDGVDTSDEANYAKISTENEKNNKLFPALDQRFYFSKLDGELLVRIGERADELYLRPGRHTLGLRFAYLNSLATGCIWIDAKAGQSYKVLKDYRYDKLYLSIQNNETGEEVGGICESEN